MENKKPYLIQSKSEQLSTAQAMVSFLDARARDLEKSGAGSGSDLLDQIQTARSALFESFQNEE